MQIRFSPDTQITNAGSEGVDKMQKKVNFFLEQKQIRKQEDIFSDHGGQGRKHQVKRRKK